MPSSHALALPLLYRATLAAISLLMVVLGAAASAAQRPNILWITSEDNGPYLGCYGDPLAHTPNLDRLAAAGVRYRNALANSPVCSTARTTLITGMYACSLGAQNHRSKVEIPNSLRLYPELLRAAGYYCTNNAKTDYNLAITRKVWDESSPRAHYRHRAAGQPFFAVFNLMTTHESQVAPKPIRSEASDRVRSEQVQLPPYHPDTPEIRLDWANYYHQLMQMDEQVGRLLAELEQEGVADETIVFYCSDHGGALPRGKRNIHDSGTRVPLIVRFPPKWAHWAPAQPGHWMDQPVSFVDLPATMLSLCGVPVPEEYQGRAFLGEAAPEPRAYVYLFRDRMDERYDQVRAIRSAEYRYVRNYSPHRPWGQHYSYPFEVLPSMRSWFAAYRGGQCNAVQARYWQPKPAEELYHIASDPHEITNLVEDPLHADQLARMRQQLRAESIALRDAGFIPEGMLQRLAGAGTIYEYARSDGYPIEQIVRVAELASSGDAQRLAELVRALEDPHPVIRYWGAVGCLILSDKAGSAKESLKQALRDPYADVRVVVAETIGRLGEADVALAALDQVLEHGNSYEVLAALNALDYLQAGEYVTLAQVQSLVKDLELDEPAHRVPQYLLKLP